LCILKIIHMSKRVCFKMSQELESSEA